LLHYVLSLWHYSAKCPAEHHQKPWRFWIYNLFRRIFQTNPIFAQNSDFYISYLLETLRNPCPLLFFWSIWGSDQDSKSFIRLMSYIRHLWIRFTLFIVVFLCLLLLLDTMTWCHFNYKVFLLTFSCSTVHTVESRPALCACARQIFYLHNFPISLINSTTPKCRKHQNPLYNAFLSRPILHMKP
jgi:hypothetical protein